MADALNAGSFAELHRRRRRRRAGLLLCGCVLLACGLVYALYAFSSWRSGPGTHTPVPLEYVHGQRIDGADRLTPAELEAEAIASELAVKKPALIPTASPGTTIMGPPAPTSGLVRASDSDPDPNEIADIIDTPDVSQALRDFESWRGGPEEYRPLSFAVLAGFEYDPFLAMETVQNDPQAPLPKQIPQRIVDLDGKRVEVRGFMLPIEARKGEVRSFLLVKNRMLCCYGAQVNMNDWVHVLVKEGVTAKAIQDVVVTVRGDFKVGEVIEDGMLTSIYRISADEISFNTGF